MRAPDQAVPSPADRMAAGRAVRNHVPLEAHADLPDRLTRDAAQWLRESSADRLPAFVHFRTERMLADPFAFLRGSADLMSLDLVGSPASGIMTTAIGDAHLANFGMYASSERQLVMDVNDFDQAAPGPWEWDLKRLVTSVVVAGQLNGISDSACAAAVVATARAYAQTVRHVATAPMLPFHAELFTVDDLRHRMSGTELSDEIDMAERKARKRTQSTTVVKFTEPTDDGRTRIIDAPPELVDVTVDNAAEVGASPDEIATAAQSYVDTLHYEWRRVLDSYTLMDVAYRVTGVGSAGLRTYLLLLSGPGVDDAFVLQMKEAGPSVLVGRCDAPPPRFAHQGERVIRYQQRSQRVSDPLLGWTTMGGRDYYVRQLRDMKGSVPIEELDGTELSIYGQLCGALLARAHARAGDPAAIAGYVGKGKRLGRALATFALGYADIVTADWEHARSSFAQA